MVRCRKRKEKAMKEYKWNDETFTVGQIVTHDIYDGFVLQMLCAGIEEGLMSYERESDDLQYLTICIHNEKSKDYVLALMELLDEIGIFYETDFPLPEDPYWR
jgi:hypothetical protein